MDNGCECACAQPTNVKEQKDIYVPFDGTKATSIQPFEDSATSSNILAVPAPTTPTLTLGVPAALRTKNQNEPIIRIYIDGRGWVGGGRRE